MKISAAPILSYRSAKVFLNKAFHYGRYANILFLIAVSIWLYIFIDKYFIGLKDDFAFMQQNIPNVSYIQLHEAGFKEVYRRYEEKIDGREERVQNVKSPF